MSTETTCQPQATDAGGMPGFANTAAPADAAAVAAPNYSIESERLLCAFALRAHNDSEDAEALKRNAVTIDTLVNLLSPTDFFLQQHQAIWTVVSLLVRASMPCDPASVSDHATRQDLFTGGVRYFVDLVDDPLHQAASHESVVQGAQRIKEMALKRRLESTLREALTLVQSGQSFANCAGYVEDAIRDLRRAAEDSRTGPQHQSVFLHQLIAKVEELQDSDRKFEGCKTGFDDLDRVTGGLADETFVVLASRPGMGKTAASLKILDAAAGDGRAAILFSLEMTGLSLARRTVAREGQIDMSRLQTGELHDQEFSSLVDAVDRLKDKSIYYDETPGLTLSEIRARAREFKRNNPKILIVIDYLQKIAWDADVKDANTHAKRCSEGLLALSRELRCPVVALSQLNRDVEKRANRRPMMSDLRESGQIEQDAHVIIFLYRDEYYNADTPEKGIAEVIVGKNRDGATCTIKTAFNGANMDFVSMGTFDHE